MPQKFLVMIPSNTHKATKNTTRTRWQSSCNIAARVQIEATEGSDARLILYYEDMEGKKRTTVDTARIGHSKSLLLSGVVDIHSLGSIKGMSLSIATSTPLVAVSCDDLFVQRKELKDENSEALVSHFAQ